jgi:hypothetical protein
MWKRQLFTPELMFRLRQVAKENHPLVQTILHKLFVARYDISTTALPTPIVTDYSKLSSLILNSDVRNATSL